MPPGRHVLCVRSTRSSLGRAGRTAYRGYHPRLTPQRPPHTPRHTVRNILVITPSVRWLSPQVLPARAARALPQLSPLKLTRAPRGPRTTVRTGCAFPPPAQCTRSVRTGGAGRPARRASRTVRILYVRRVRVPDSGALRAYRGAPGVFFGWVIYLSLLLNEGDAEADGEAA